MDKIRINLFELLLALSDAQDLVSPKLYNHQQQVACLAYHLAVNAGLPPDRQKDVFLAALVHDIGALSTAERLDIIENEPANPYSHGYKGAHLLMGFKPLRRAARIIKHHHLPWRYGEGSTHEGEPVPYASHIIHLADRVCIKVRRDENILNQLPEIISDISQDKKSMYEPDLINALTEISKFEYIWLDLMSKFPAKRTFQTQIMQFDDLELGIDDIIEISNIFSRIIDFRSRFTACHSAGVAITAERLACCSGFSETEQKMMLIAGFLHDLGKLAIDNSILEKNAALSKQEYNVIRSHTYYTYHLLNPLKQFDTIKEWAAFHHERLDGNGYPFHIKGSDMTQGSRIMAVADIFTAITEDRPYRKGMDKESTVKVLNNMVSNGAIDCGVVQALFDDFNAINELREQAQQEAAFHYENFLSELIH